MSGLAVSNHVVVRDDFGRFIKACNDAAAKVVDDAIDTGVALSAGYAPTGYRADPRTAKLHDSFFAERISRTQGYWGNDARHALFVEFGTNAHPISGHLEFFWEKYFRMFIPSGEIDTVQHPGTHEQPYLRPAYKVVQGMIPGMMRKYYPG